MNKYCPDCGSEMVSAEINPVSDLAKCDDCGALHNIAALVDEPRPKPRNLYEVPLGSRFEIHQGRNKALRLRLPPSGFHWFHFILIPFVLFWVGFVGFWTYMAMKGSYIFALFSLPFWYAGFSMLKGLFLSIWGWQEVMIDRQHIELRQGWRHRHSTESIPMRDVVDIALRYRAKNDESPSQTFKNMRFETNQKRNYLRQPCIATEEEQHFFFQSASELEQDWVIELLNDLRLKLA